MRRIDGTGRCPESSGLRKMVGMDGLEGEDQDPQFEMEKKQISPDQVGELG